MYRRLARWMALMAVLWMIAFPQAACALLVPQSTLVGPGSAWMYRSNLGTARAEILTQTPAAEQWTYTWRFSVAGMHYEETLRLTPQTLSVIDRQFRALGVYRDAFSFPDDELTLRLPLQVGSTWDWQGAVVHGRIKGVTRVQGRVVQQTRVKVAAGEYAVYEIVLDRSDDFGTLQHIRLWFNLDVGVIKAEGHLRWRGLIGHVQDLIGFAYLAVELQSVQLQPAGVPAKDVKPGGVNR